MAIKFYVPVNDKTKLTRKMYCSVDGKTKLVKRLYTSINGKAKLIYDTVNVTYKKDTGYDNGGYVYSTERIAKHTKATNVDNVTWYSANSGVGPKYDFSNQVLIDTTLYGACYYYPSTIPFYGDSYVPTDVPVPRSEMDIRTYNVTPTDITPQRRVYSIRGNPTADLYINGSGYYNFGVGNTESSITWSAAGNKVKAAKNTGMHSRLNISGSNRYAQVWPGTDGNWTQVPSITQNSTNNKLVIGAIGNETDRQYCWYGTLGQITLGTMTFDPCWRYNETGSFVYGYMYNKTKKFYPRVYR